MHGIILKGLKDFTVENYGESVWDQMRDEADVDRTLYVPVTDYPDEHVVELVTTASELSGVDTPDLMRAFGRFIVPMLVKYYGVHVQEDWDGLELVENVEEYIHMALRSKNLSEFDPPSIDARREGEHRVVVEYGSDRELCDVAIGILEGVGEFYEETYDITEQQCMHGGAATCKIVVAREAAPRRSTREGDDVMATPEGTTGHRW